MENNVYFYKSFYTTDPQHNPDDWELIHLCTECASEYQKDGYNIEQIDLAGQNDFCIDCGKENI